MLLGLELLAAWGTMSGRQDDPVGLVCVLLGLLHLIFVVMAEQTSVALPWAGAFAAAVVAELAIAIAFMTVRSMRATLTPEMALARMSAARGAPNSALPAADGRALVTGPLAVPGGDVPEAEKTVA
jgi:protein-S-isoprenylcysteine O-methyltransferase Ste14